VKISGLVIVVCAATCVAACGGGSTSKVVHAAAATRPAAATKQSQVKPQVAWCNVTLGATKTQILAAMGTANGHQADPYKSLLASGQEFAEWDVGSDIFVATFTDGKATNLQAYGGAIGPNGPTDIACEPFRHTTDDGSSQAPNAAIAKIWGAKFCQAQPG
jgi:hypothetical protein